MLVATPMTHRTTGRNRRQPDYVSGGALRPAAPLTATLPRLERSSKSVPRSVILRSPGTAGAQ
jgi:hypothetical protein